MNIAIEPADSRHDAFAIAGAKRGLLPLIIEKDFWVCWTLEHLFSLPDFGEHLLFKGSTSLSKVYGVIQRFSEDIDLSLSRTSLGGDPADAAGTSAIVTVEHHFSETRPNPQTSADDTLVITSTDRDFWSKTDTGWLLKRQKTLLRLASVTSVRNATT